MERAAPAVGLDVESVRSRFSSLRGGFHFFDAPGGTQVPDGVGEAVARAMREASGNLGAPYETGHRVERILGDAKAAGARMLGCDPGEVIFGANMTTLNFALARTFARELRAGDEIVVTRLDHDGGVAPWVELARDLELVVRHVDVREDLTLDYDDLERQLTERTRVVAFAWASNAVGSLTDAQGVCTLAREAGALSWIDAVHYAAHEPIDVRVAAHVRRDERGALAEPFRHRPTVVRIAVGQDHPPATLDDDDADRLPEERGGAGDDDDAILEVAHVRPRRRRAGAAWRPPRRRAPHGLPRAR